MKFKCGPHYGIDADFYGLMYSVLQTCPAVQERARQLCAEIAGPYDVALYECVTTSEAMPDIEKRHGLKINALQKYTENFYRRMCGENLGIWIPQQLPDRLQYTAQKQGKSTTVHHTKRNCEDGGVV